MCACLCVRECGGREGEKKRRTHRERERVHTLVKVRFRALPIRDKFSITDDISRFLMVTQI